ncbi:di-trans,poly-cis-decaprenylcistransferase [bacterium]|nr:di-trans,poly-cis-decaprenylcistransferase [bacterium]
MTSSTSTPRHVAIIMDGNGRWAQSRGHRRIYGHVRGASRVKAIVREADRLGVKALTLFAFSTENWLRPELELQVLWKLLKKYLVLEQEELLRENVRLRVIGEVDRLSADVRAVLDPAVEKLSGNTGLQLTFAISYGSRRELTVAASRFAKDCVEGKRSPGEMNEKLLSQYLWTSYLGDLAEVDLMIRTSGEHRVSNFLLWQSAYAEFVFTDLCWPDFRPYHLREAVEKYSHRERRYGAINAASAAGAQPI